MKKISVLLFSPKTTLILLVIFAIAIGVATFIEQNHDTETAKLMVYNARWMEVLLLLSLVNLTGSIIQRKLYTKEKLTIFLVHAGFIFMLIGAAVTRYIGYEGTMHIREGESSNEIFSNERFLVIKTADDQLVEQYLIDLKSITTKPFEFDTEIDPYGEVEIRYKDYIYNAVERVFEDQPGGRDMLEIRVATDHGNVSGILEEGSEKNIGALLFSFQHEAVDSSIQIFIEDGKALMKAPYPIFTAGDEGEIRDSVKGDTIVELLAKQIYSVNSVLFMPVQYYRKAKTKLVSDTELGGNPDALTVEVSYKGKSQDINIFGGSGYVAQPELFRFDDMPLKIGYGNVPIQVPFSIYLEDFKLERYPGSNSPSSYESKVILTDHRNNLKQSHKIYMNNVLDYDGYRFFQSSYDRDERGTILSVSHDWWGTLITYFSYILLLVGFIATFFNSNSRFNQVRRQIAASRTGLKSLLAVFFIFLGGSFSAFSQVPGIKPVDKTHADEFGHLIVQTFDGRFQPVHTLANDVMHKLYKKNLVEVTGKGKLNAMQFYLDLIIDGEFWKSQKIIYVKDDMLQNVIGITGDYASAYDFFDSKGLYKLEEYTDNAYRKGKSEQNNFDREVMKVNERLNILLMTINGSMLKIFPDPNSKNHEWVSIDDSASFRPLTGGITAINEDLQLKQLSYGTILQLYFHELTFATISGHYSRADQILGYMKSIQRQIGSSEVLPSESKIDMEVRYNKANFFVLLKYVYMILSVLLLIAAFMIHLREKSGRLLNYVFYFLAALLAGALFYHTYGLVLRWYLTGHAPWSNGYEVLVFVPWVSVITGFIFMRYSKIVLAATALLAFFMLLTAGFSNYDPQLTNLQPVLKSYWLIIHVAVIVISYGLFGIGFVLGLINLFMYIFKTAKQEQKMNSIIKSLTFINEISLSFGIAMATIGTFLGAVWANESWGRYWGWDAKETWALIILMVYAVVLHLRMIPNLKKSILFNSASVVAFGTVIMTFFGVNYYLSKGLHSYASGSGGIFPLWAWIAIIVVFLLIFAAYNKQKKFSEPMEEVKSEE